MPRTPHAPCSTTMDFIISPRTIEISQGFQVKFRRPGIVAKNGWIGLFRAGQTEAQLEGRRFYYDDDAYTHALGSPNFGAGAKDLRWSEDYAPQEPGEYELRYYRSHHLLGCSKLRAVPKGEGPHKFTKRFCAGGAGKDYEVTTESDQAQSPFWPSYLPVDPSRFLIIERSKNASLVVYHGIGLMRGRSTGITTGGTTSLGESKSTGTSISSRNSSGSRKNRKGNTNVIALRWLSWGWTTEPETNLTNTLQRKMAYGMHVEQVSCDDNTSKNTYTVTMVAIPSMKGRLEMHPDGTGPRLVFPVLPGGGDAVIQKLFVCTRERLLNPIPKVLYVDLYGYERESGRSVYVRYDAKKIGIQK